MTKNFLRVDSARYSKLGKGRRKLQKWRKPKGRDNKMREKMVEIVDFILLSKSGIGRSETYYSGIDKLYDFFKEMFTDILNEFNLELEAWMNVHEERQRTFKSKNNIIYIQSISHKP